MRIGERAVWSRLARCFVAARREQRRIIAFAPAGPSVAAEGRAYNRCMRLPPTSLRPTMPQARTPR